MKKNVKIAAVAGVVAVVAVGGTFAYYNAQQTFVNPFHTTNYGSSATEKFNPAEGGEWKPGKKVDKVVSATNTGDGDVWVRVKFDETWTRGSDYIVGETIEDDVKGWTSKDDGFNVAKPKDGKKPVADNHQIDNKKDDLLDGEHDGITSADTGSVVYKEIVNEESYDTPDKWFYNSNDGYYYYTSTLAGGHNNSTPHLLESVTLCSDADMGKYNDEDYFIIFNEVNKNDLDENDMKTLTPSTASAPSGKPEFGTWYKGKVTKDSLTEWYKDDEDIDVNNLQVFTYQDNELDATAQGYANADYALNITVEFIQTTEEGEELAANWDWHPGAEWAEKTVTP